MIIEILKSGGRPKRNCAPHALTKIASGTLGHSWRLNWMVCGWSHLMWVHTVVYLLACEEMVKWWILILLDQKLWENCDRITVLILISSGTSYILSMIMSFLTIRYRTRNKRQLLRYSGIGNSLTRGCESCCWHTWIKIRVPSTTITPYLGTYLVLRYCAMYFGHSLHALLHSNIASQWSILMGLICMVNIEGCWWLQWQPMLTTRFCLSPLLLWTRSQGLVGGGF